MRTRFFAEAQNDTCGMNGFLDFTVLSPMTSGSKTGGNTMLNVMSLRNGALKRPRVSSLSIIVLAVALVGTSVTADSPSDPKRVAFEAVDRNAEAIATVGDVLYYFAEPGM